MFALYQLGQEKPWWRNWVSQIVLNSPTEPCYPEGLLCYKRAKKVNVWLPFSWVYKIPRLHYHPLIPPLYELHGKRYVEASSVPHQVNQDHILVLRSHGNIGEGVPEMSLDRRMGGRWMKKEKRIPAGEQNACQCQTSGLRCTQRREQNWGGRGSKGLPRESALNNKHLFLEAGKSKIRGLVDSLSDENPLPGLETAVFSLCPHMVEGVGEPSGVSCIRALIPFIGAQPSWLHHLPKAPPPNTVMLGISFNIGILGDTNDQSIAKVLCAKKFKFILKVMESFNLPSPLREWNSKFSILERFNTWVWMEGEAASNEAMIQARSVTTLPRDSGIGRFLQGRLL